MLCLGTRSLLHRAPAGKQRPPGSCGSSRVKTDSVSSPDGISCRAESFGSRLDGERSRDDGPWTGILRDYLERQTASVRCLKRDARRRKGRRTESEPTIEGEGLRIQSRERKRRGTSIRVELRGQEAGRGGPSGPKPKAERKRGKTCESSLEEAKRGRRFDGRRSRRDVGAGLCETAGCRGAVAPGA